MAVTRVRHVHPTPDAAPDALDVNMVAFTSAPLGPTRVPRTRPRQVRRAVTTELSRRNRTMTIVAQDPSVVVDGELLTAAVDVPAEPLLPGPRGQRFFVVDFTPGSSDFNRPHILTVTGNTSGERGWNVIDKMRGRSKAEIVGDAACHAQNLYATCASILAKFEQTLGRRIPWSFETHHLYLVPHAFVGGNANYSPDDRCISFGYLPAVNGRQPIYTCLSHDIIAHEMAHAILDGLRPRYIEPGLPDQIAFHEGFADIVALLSVLAHAEIVERAFQLGTPPSAAEPGENLFIDMQRFDVANLKTSILFGLGEQLGHSIDPGLRALRNAFVDVPVGKAWRMDCAFDLPHRRGEVLVAAVCEAVARIWWGRLDEIRRHSQVPLRRAAEEGAKVAEQVLGMCIRALDYLPPISFDFGDFVDAILAADEVVAPEDERHYRGAIAAAFAAFDVHPPTRVSTTPTELIHPWRLEGVNLRVMGNSPQEVFKFIWQNAENLDIHLDVHLRVERVLAATRTGPDGLVVEEIIADYTQTAAAQLGDLPEDIRRGVRCDDDVEVQMWGGGVIVFDQFGTPRHHVTKNICHTPEDRERQRQRLTYLAANGITDKRGRLGFSTGRTEAAMFHMLHDDEFEPAERWQ